MDDSAARARRRPGSLYVPLFFPLIRPPVGYSGANEPRTRSRLRRWTPWAVLGAAVVMPFATTLAFPSVGGVSGQLPIAAVDLAASFTRLVVAYAFSLVFALVYGYYAATSRRAERVLIPSLDILQSVPILGFIPPLLALAGALVTQSVIVLNLIVIVGVFTAMSWNMAFGVYESLKSLPNDLVESANSFGVRGWQRMRRLVFPATTNRLIYNTVLSWTAGWYFLVGAEIISAGKTTSTVPGIGSYLAVAAFDNQAAALVTGLSLLIILVTVLDLVVWRPAGRWAEKFRYEQSPGGEEIQPSDAQRTPAIQRAAGFVYRGFAQGVSRIGVPVVTFVRRVPVGGIVRARRRTRSFIRALIFGALFVVGWLVVIELGVAIYHVFVAPIPPSVLAQIESLPLALVYSLGRIAAAYAISVAVVLPLAILIVSRPRAFAIGMPVVEIVASVPASSLFPLFIIALSPFVGLNGIAILLLVTGMAWYLFFNVVSGLRAVPSDLKESAQSYGLSRRLYYRRLILPAILPAFVTGSITAVGSGWNTLVFAEYFQVQGTVALQVLGVGQLISVASLGSSTIVWSLWLASLFTLIITVIVVNELLWKPLYRRATTKYRFD